MRNEPEQHVVPRVDEKPEMTPPTEPLPSSGFPDQYHAELDDYDKALEEYDATVKGAETAPAELPVEAVNFEDYVSQIDAKAELAAVQSRVVSQAYAHRDQIARAQELHDLERTLFEIRKSAPELNVYSDKSLIERFVGRWNSDPAFARDWNNRRAVPGAWSSRLQKVVSEFSAELSKRYDPDATADKAAVTHLMTRGARRGGSYEEPFPDVTRMPEHEFEALKAHRGWSGQR